MLLQLQRLKDALPAVHWTLTTSRRTPDEFYASTQSLADARFTVIPVDNTDTAWLKRQYAQSGTIWVSEDSVSMIYESLSSGARVGVLSVPRKSQSRVSQGVDELLEKEQLINLEQLNSKGMMPNHQAEFCEANRIAAHIASILRSKAR